MTNAIYNCPIDSSDGLFQESLITASRWSTYRSWRRRRVPLHHLLNSNWRDSSWEKQLWSRQRSKLTAINIIDNTNLWAKKNEYKERADSVVSSSRRWQNEFLFRLTTQTTDRSKHSYVELTAKSENRSVIKLTKTRNWVHFGMTDK